MDSHVLKYYKDAGGNQVDAGRFHQVIPLHEKNDLSWEKVNELHPGFPRGWFELSHLSAKDRIDFTKEYWMATLPYHPALAPFLETFFSGLDDLGIFLVQPKYDDAYFVHMVYSLKDEGGFFHGLPPASEQAVKELQEAFSHLILPHDFCAFMRIHNGFSKVNDTGVLPVQEIPYHHNVLYNILEVADPIINNVGDVMDPLKLVPFYRSFSSRSYQCFWDLWHPDQEMGNIYLSPDQKSASKIHEANDPSMMSFATFTDWLVFYLERIA